MGTIDISYLSLGIGLLLLSIPLFYIWKFKTGLLRATLIGTARMIVQLFMGHRTKRILRVGRKRHQSY